MSPQGYYVFMYTINSRLLKELIQNLGDNAMARASLGANVSLSTLQKMCGDAYPSEPRKNLKMRLSSFFKVDESVLFPPAKKKRSA
jgi:hypothetical protein